jgi:methyl-accepting chemotaxis protein
MAHAIRTLSLSTKIILLVVLTVAIVGVANLVLYVRDFRSHAIAALVEEAEAFTSVADATKNHVSSLALAGVYDTDSLLEEVASTVAAGGDYRSTRVFGTIPVVAGWTAARNAAQDGGIAFQIVAVDARNPEYEASRDPDAGALRVSMLGELADRVGTGDTSPIWRLDQKGDTLRIMRPIIADESCMMCHGQPGHATGDPDGDGRDPLGFEMERWSLGQMHGAYEVAYPMAPVRAGVFATTARTAGVTAIFVIGTCGLLALLFRVQLVRPLREIMEVIQKMRDGDLTHRAPTGRSDELGVLAGTFNTFADHLERVIGEVNDASHQVASAATQIAAGSEEMAVGMGEQTRQVHQVSAAIEQMSGSVGEVARKSEQAVELAGGAGRDAGEGREIVGETVREMEGIAEQVTGTAASVATLGKRSEEIGQVIGLITEVADQTNLLALNAAIEAARAGEHGRGFAVVADEVRKLAERTQKATQQVTQSIGEIQNETGVAVGEMERGREKVAEGVAHAQEADGSLARIVDGAAGVEREIRDIAAAASQQATTADQIARNLEAIGSVTQETNEGAAQAAQAAAALSGQAESLRTLVGRFKIRKVTG